MQGQYIPTVQTATQSPYQSPGQTAQVESEGYRYQADSGIPPMSPRSAKLGPQIVSDLVMAPNGQVGYLVRSPKSPKSAGNKGAGASSKVQVNGPSSSSKKVDSRSRGAKDTQAGVSATASSPSQQTIAMQPNFHPYFSPLPLSPPPQDPNMNPSMLNAMNAHFPNRYGGFQSLGVSPTMYVTLPCCACLHNFSPITHLNIFKCAYALCTYLHCNFYA
jgi:hypothetical protein